MKCLKNFNILFENFKCFSNIKKFENSQQMDFSPNISWEVLLFLLKIYMIFTIFFGCKEKKNNTTFGFQYSIPLRLNYTFIFCVKKLILCLVVLLYCICASWIANMAIVFLRSEASQTILSPYYKGK